MTLHGLKIQDKGTGDIFIQNEKIDKIIYSSNDSYKQDSVHIYFDDAYAFPGLINSHDHLEFNLFPQLGNRIYKNYLEWGIDIHMNNRTTIQQVLKIPKPIRTLWGIYKNLVSGVTTIVHHGEQIDAPQNLINIFSGFKSLHSVKLEKHWKYRLNMPFSKHENFAIHIGEGTDPSMYKEIEDIIRWNLLRKNLIGIHGIAMSEQQAKQFKAIVWCPTSNFFLYNATSKINEIKASTNILFGTDATVSADWNIWNHLRQARTTGMLTDVELIGSVGDTAARVWGLERVGRIEENYQADIVISKLSSRQGDDCDQFFATNPELIQMVISKGNIVLFDASMYDQLNNIISEEYTPIYINGRKKYVKGNIHVLIRQIKNYYPEVNLFINIDA